MAAFDFKTQYKEFYLSKNRPELITVPPANFIAIRGKGDPNEEEGEYKRAIGVLYAVAYTLRMSAKSGHTIEGFFEYVVPPLEGFWRQEGVEGVDYANKASFEWVSVIRLPDFIGKSDFDWAVAQAAQKKKLDCSAAELVTIDEGLCVQMMHIGPFDDEPTSVALMHEYLAREGFAADFSDARRHHEIYLSDPRRIEPARLRTVIRHPVKRI